jgi:hypothetical protein
MNQNLGSGLNSSLFLILGLVSYILLAWPLYVMGTKSNSKNPWFAFVPILNLVLLVEIAGKELWWVLLMFVPCINLFVILYIWMQVAEAMNKPGWVGLLMIVPGVNFLVPFYLAFA